MKKLSLICLTISLAGCASGLPKPPSDKVRIPDMQHGVCTIYQVVDPIRQTYKKVETNDISACDGAVCLAPKDFKLWQSWLIDVNTNYTCTEKKQ